MTRAFLALAIAEVFSLSGTRLSMIAIPWLVLTTTGDPFLTGAVAFAEMLPYVAAKALGGPFIDRMGARTISILGDFASMVTVALVPVLYLTGNLSIYVLLPLVAVMGALRGPAESAKHAMVPAVAAAGNLPLERVTGVTGTIERLASTIGAAMAGGLVAAVGPALALGVNVLTLGASAMVLLLGTSAKFNARSEQDFSTAESYAQELRTGWRFLKGDAVLVGIVVMVAITNFVDQANFSVLMPVWAESTGEGATILGMVLACFSGFSVLGAAIATGMAEKMPRLVVYTTAFLIAGLPRFLIFTLDVPTAAILSVVAVAGFSAGFLNPILSAVIFERIPKPLVGRVSSLVTALCYTLMPLGGLAAGALVTAFGLNAALLAAGLIYLGATMLPLTLKSFRALAERPAPQT